MEPLESAARQKSTKSPRDKNPLQRKWGSEPSASSRRSTFADPEVKSHSHRETPQSIDGDCASGGVVGPPHQYGSGKLQSSAIGQSQDSQYPPLFPGAYPYQLPPSYPQQPIQERFLPGNKSQPGLESHAWSFVSHIQSLTPEELFPVHSRGHGGVFPRRKSPSLPASFRQYSQSGMEPPEEGHKKEQKPKKPGKYICHYCGRACAKPSVLKKHIRSHTGERPYPCIPCGFSFKTKSNLYKHRKSHAHAIKAGLVPFSELAAARGDIDQGSLVVEREVHSDGDQSTDTDEEGAEGSMDKSSPVPQISFEADKSTIDKSSEVARADSGEELASMKVPILIEIEGSPTNVQMGRPNEPPTVKQKLVLRLSEKKSEDTEQSLNLLSPHSKGSTDSGYFSRSESAEQQISPPNTNVKSYEEIMFGRTWYYKPNSRPRQSMTVAMSGVTGQDSNVIDLNIKTCGIYEMDKISQERISHFYSKEDVANSIKFNIVLPGEMAAPPMVGCDPKQYTTSSSGHLEAPSDSGTLIRSNSVPTSSAANLNVPQGIRCHSFDEVMTSDDVFYPGSAGMRRLRRQAAFEHSAHEGHTESDNYGKNLSQPSVAMRLAERGLLMPDSKVPGMDYSDMRAAYLTYGTKVGITEPSTRKRRKEKSVGEEEDSPTQYGSELSEIEMRVTPGDYDSKQEISRANPSGTGHMYCVQSQSDSFDKAANISSEDVVLVHDVERKAAGNVISVIQHTNSLSRPNSFEKAESIEHPSYQQDKLPGSQYSEQLDSENLEEMQSPDSLPRSESVEQQQSDSELVALPSNQQYHMPHKLVRQPNIQVPEIRVTEEPDKSEKELEVPIKEPEKHVEEFQWPQRSETLSQLPAEKLPPKKKRLRLADMEHSSGESSFESTCTSLSRSPSQESNLSHSSSFSMSFDREENVKSISPTKQDDGGKQSEFLTVPGSGHSLSIPSHHQREMRRSSSEQAPSALQTEIPEIRSKSFDYGSLSPSSRQGEVYVSTSAMKERKRGYLVRQASLSVYPETASQEQSPDSNIKQEHSEHTQSGLFTSQSAWHSSEVARCRRTTAIGPHLQKSISEDSLQEGYLLSHKTTQGPGKHQSEGEHGSHEVLLYSSLQGPLAQPPFLQYKPEYWNIESSQRHKQHLAFQMNQLQKLHSRQTSAQPTHQKLMQLMQEQDSAKADAIHNQNYQYPPRASSQHQGQAASKSLSTSTVLLQQVQPVFATQQASSQSPVSSMLVPVRIQTHVPSFGSVMYTSVSQILATHGQSVSSSRVILSDGTSPPSLTSTSSAPGVGFSLSQILGHSAGLLRYPSWKVPEPLPGRLNTGIPLSLTSGTISTTDASSSIGGSKRMLSPASSLELFIETKQQKRVKEEKMYGQIVKELSAVELSNSNVSKDSGKPELLKSDSSLDCQDEMDLPSCNAPLRLSASNLQEIPPSESLTPPLQIVTDTPDGRESPEELDVDESTPKASSSPQTKLSSSDSLDETKSSMTSKIPVNMIVQLAANHGGGVAGSTFLFTDLADVHQFFQFPSLRTTTSVSWCFLNYTKPNFAQTTPHTSVYGTWCISSYNPNPPSLNTKTTLSLLRSKQRKYSETYTMAPMYRPGTGKLVSSLSWKQRFDQTKPELMQLDVSKSEKKMKGHSSRDKAKEDGEKDVSPKQPEPIRIKIFEGGYKSNEDYVYVRGRGRGKYICEECGIRCKKPSMLKKHIRTHTDVRPYVCKFCNFAFKTKGNLTKHMKSKAHMKKCLELGVSVTSVDDAEADDAENIDDNQREPGKPGEAIMAKHQFSDAEDSDGAEEDGDEIDDDDDDDDEYDGDSTPKTCSRSTSPQPYGMLSLSVTATQGSSSDHSKPPLFSYFANLPSIQITQLMAPSERPGEAQMEEYQKLLQGALGEGYKSRLDVPSSMDEDFARSPEQSSSSLDLSPSRLSSPGCDSSPLRESSPTSRRYLSPRRDLSPRGRLSPRRDVSPLRHISPRRDLSLRRELSPRRDLSPRGHLSPSCLARPLSPGKDLCGRRELSPRSRHRGMIRAVSPRRGSHHYSTPWTVGQYLQSEKSKSGPNTEMDSRRSGLHRSSHIQSDQHSGQESLIHQGLFSHLPLHSQQQLRTPFPMIPIGGIQMVHSVPAASASSPRLLLQKSTSEESSGEVPPQLPEGGRGKRPKDVGRPPERLAVSPPQRPREDSVDITDQENKQEESIHTCTKAIASLSITAEGSLETPSEPRVQHFSEVDGRQPMPGTCAGSPDPGGDQDKTVLLGPSTPHGTNTEERSEGQQGPRELPASTTRSQDSAKEAMENSG